MAGDGSWGEWGENQWIEKYSEETSSVRRHVAKPTSRDSCWRKGDLIRLHLGDGWGGGIWSDIEGDEI